MAIIEEQPGCRVGVIPAAEETFTDYRRFQSIAPSTVQINGAGEIVSGSMPENGRVPDKATQHKTSAPRQIESTITPEGHGVIFELVDSTNGIISKDRSSNYNVAEMQESARKGAEGKGTSEKTFAELEAEYFNHGTGVPVEE